MNKTKKHLSVFAAVTVLLLLVATLSACSLFECQHEYESTVHPATCTDDGYTDFVCKKCGDAYTSDQTDKLGHKYTSESYATDCHNEGYTEHTCSACADVYRDAFVAKTTHRFNGGACLNCGDEEITESITANTEWYSETGATFTLSTAEQLAGLAELVNGGTNFAGVVIHLANDIDLGYSEWLPIGNAEHAFAGTFDGEGKTIYGLKINAKSSYTGLFGNVSGELRALTLHGATVYSPLNAENVGIAAGYVSGALSDISVTGYVDAKDSTSVGGVVGQISIDSSITEKLSASASVHGSGYTGGIIGSFNALGTAHCYNMTFSGDVLGGEYTGGIVGSFSALGAAYSDNMSFTGSVSGKVYTGGVYGYIKASAGSLVRSSSVCADIVGDYYVGGIVGKADGVGVASCSNAGSSISAKSALIDGDSFYAYLGGYAGYAYSASDCTNTVAIDYTSRGSYVGGVAGYIANVITACTNNATVNGYGYVGGVAGMLKTPAGGASVIGLTNTGNISGTADYIGGTIGYISPDGSIGLADLTNSGSISGASYIGGTVGGCNGSGTVTAQRLNNTGSVNASGHSVGGAIGMVKGDTSSAVKGSSSSAAISGQYKVGGIVGDAVCTLVANCSNAGTTISAAGWCTDNNSNYAWVGGYVGCGYAVSDCINDVEINYGGVGMYVGGISGYLSRTAIKCTNNATVTSGGSYVGGIVGRAHATEHNLTHRDLKNTGAITGIDHVGGIAGTISAEISSGDGTKADQHNYYFVTYASGLENSGSVTGVNKVGGIFGESWFNNNYTWRGYDCCSRWNQCTRIDDWKLIATSFINTGDVIADTCGGELIGSFSSDEPSTLDSYKLGGTLSVNGNTLTDTPVSTNSGLTLSNPILPEIPDAEDGEGDAEAGDNDGEGMES